MENPAESWWDWFEARAEGPHALFWLALVSFLEPILLPLMPEVVMAPLILARPKRWRDYVAVTAFFSVLGGVVGYFPGAFFFSVLGPPLLSHWGLSSRFHVLQYHLDTHVFWIMLLLMFSPAPDKAFVLLAGFLRVPFLPYIVGFALGRILRFSIVGYLVHRFGGHILRIVREYVDWFAVLLLLILSLLLLHVLHLL